MPVGPHVRSIYGGVHPTSERGRAGQGGLMHDSYGPNKHISLPRSCEWLQDKMRGGIGMQYGIGVPSSVTP